MPRISFADRLDGVLREFNVSADLHKRIMNGMFAQHNEHNVALKKAARADQTWKTLLDDVRAVLRGLSSNVHKQEGELRDLYERYIHLVRQARDDIAAASTLLLKNKDDPTGPKLPATLDDVRRLAAKRNAKTGEDGPTCTARWHTWVHPADRKAIKEAFDLAYDRATRGRGRRVLPFLTTDVLEYNQARLTTFRKFIADKRQALTEHDPRDPRDPTEYRQPVSPVPLNALHLAAARMAERALNAWETAVKHDKYYQLDNPMPVKWTDLLDSTMRERIRAADLNPSNVSIMGIESFYWDNGSDRSPAIETPDQRAANLLANDWD